MTFALIAFVAMLALILLRIPIAFAMIIVGYLGFGLLVGWNQSLSMIGQVAYDTGLNYEFSVLPLFILMGNFTTRAGDSDHLYEASNAFLGHMRGGLAMATVVACGGFAAISGSSLATAATFAKVAMPPMRRFGYSDQLAAASIAAGGTLGILIPPSVIMVIYGIITETNIGKLFIAGIIPGIIGILGYTTAIQIVTRLRPDLGPPAVYTPWPGRLAALRKVWGILFLFVLVMGGIYGGIFTSTEAAGIGAGGAFLLALFRGKLTWKVLFEVLIESARSTAMLFFILIGALVISNLVNVAGLPTEMTAWVKSLDVPAVAVLFVIIGLYLVLGSFLESVSMVLLTVPIFFPIVMALGYDPVWFGIIVVVITEIGLIHPPLGLNVYVLTSLLPDISAGKIFRGLVPFLIADFIRLLILIALPIIVLFLPSLM
jgi:tripartite ATP-independent transporter DctM subunit